MQMIVTCGIAGVILGMSAGVTMGYHWGHKDGRRQKELEEAFDQGQWDHGSRLQRDECPYEGDEELAEQWLKGWTDADQDGIEHQMEMRRDLDEQG